MKNRSIRRILALGIVTAMLLGSLGFLPSVSAHPEPAPTAPITLPDFIEISTDKRFYEVGETVNMTMTNNGDIPVNFSESRVFSVTRGGTAGYVVAPFWGGPLSPITWTLNPGATESWAWNQHGYSWAYPVHLDTGIQVPVNIYRAWFANGGDHDSAWLAIVNDTIEVTTDNNEYFADEDVVVTVKNIAMPEDPETEDVWWYFVDENGDLLWSDITEDVNLAVDDTLQYTWNQTDYDGQHVAFGEWTVMVKFIELTPAYEDWDVNAANFVIKSPLEWAQVSEDGFGDRNNTFVSAKSVYGEHLYAGTMNLVTGGEIWRYDGENWTQVNEDGFGDSANAQTIPNVAFGGYLYASTQNSDNGTEVWRYGSPWTQVNIDGFGDRNNYGTERAAVFDGKYYIGTSNDVTGSEIWRTSDGTTWTQVNEDGFGNPNNVAADAYVFGDHLYVGTLNWVDGGEIWRTSDGENWTQVNSGGFGDPNNLETYTSVAFEGYLYAGAGNLVTGVEIWRSSDGTTWENVMTGGFGDPTNMWGYPYGLFDGYLYAGTGGIDKAGTEIWRSADGTTWTQVNIDGFGDTNNRDSYPWWVYDDKLYLATWNEVTGGEVWVGVEREVHQIDMTLKVAGRKDNTVTLQVYEDGELIEETSVTRALGSPDEQAVTIDLTHYSEKEYEIVLIYDAAHKGANPTWLTFACGENTDEFFVNFNTKDGYYQEVPVDSLYLDSVV